MFRHSRSIVDQYLGQYWSEDLLAFHQDHWPTNQHFQLFVQYPVHRDQLFNISLKPYLLSYVLTLFTLFYENTWDCPPASCPLCQYSCPKVPNTDRQTDMLRCRWWYYLPCVNYSLLHNLLTWFSGDLDDPLQKHITGTVHISKACIISDEYFIYVNDRIQVLLALC